MKKWIMAAMTLLMVACQQDSGSNNGATPNNNVMTPLTANCLNGQTYCNNQGYNQFPGFMPYPGMYNYAYDYRTYFNNNGFCNCPSGSMPVYNGTYGLGCVRQQYLQPISGFFLNWQWGSGAVGWGTVPGYGYGGGYGYGYGYGGYGSYGGYGYSAPQMPINMPQYSNIPTAPNSYGNCSRNLTQSCVISQANSCGVGATCRQVVSGSGLGICVSGL